MGILRSDRVSGLGGANAINGSVFFGRNGVPATASGNWLTVYSEDDFKFGTGDFTIEAWIYYTGTTASSNSGFFQISNTPGGINNANNASDGGLAGDFEGGVIKGIGNGNWFNGTTSVTAQSWIHVAMVRHSGTLQWFVNGTADTSASDSNNYSLTHLAIGGYYTTSYLFSGYISNFRIVKGTAVYSAAFTPPTERLTAIDGTVLLACQSPGNIFQEATGKTLDIRKVTLNDAPPMASRFVPDKGEDHGTTLGDNTKFDTLSYMVPPGGTTAQRGRGTALFGGGYKTPNSITAIDYLSIQSGGQTQEWGNLSTVQLASGAALSSNTRYVKGGGWVSPLNNNAIEYVTFTTSGNSLEFGDLTLGRRNIGSHSNDTRGLWAGGYISPADAGTDTIDYITIATTGNAADFGNLSAVSKSNNGTGSTTRAVFTLGTSSPAAVDTIEYVTIASTGNYTDFGNLEDPLRDNGSCSNGTRAVFAGGTRFPHNAVINTLQFITISSTGNTSNFGDLTLARGAIGGTSNGTRGVFMGGTTNPARQDTIDSVIIATTGEAVNWGEFRTAKQGLNSAASDSHGGIS